MKTLLSCSKVIIFFIASEEYEFEFGKTESSQHCYLTQYPKLNSVKLLN